MKREEIFEGINIERIRQDGLHPNWEEKKALQVLVEEVGEVAKALNDRDIVNLEEELFHVAAVCVRWLENL